MGFSPEFCPICGRPVTDGRTCPCLLKTTWWHLPPSPFPQGLRAWLVVLLVIPLVTAVYALAWYFDSKRFTEPLTYFALALPFFVQLVPTGRRRGGCVLGVWMVLTGFVVAAVARDVADGYVPAWKRERPPAARLRAPEHVTIGGLTLGMSEKEVESLVGPGTPVGPLASYQEMHYGRRAHYVTYGPQRVAVRIEGLTLEQYGTVLARVGDPRSRRDHLFYKGTERPVNPIEGHFRIACPGDRITQIVMVQDDAPDFVKHPNR